MPFTLGARGSGLVITGTAAFAATPKVPRHVVERLLRIGYVRVEGSGLVRSHADFAADELDRMEGDTSGLNKARAWTGNSSLRPPPIVME